VAGRDDLAYGSVENWLACQTLRLEAEALIGAGPSSRPTTVPATRISTRPDPARPPVKFPPASVPAAPAAPLDATKLVYPLDLSQARAKAHLLGRQFDAAAADYGEAIELAPKKVEFWYFRMCLLAYLAKDKLHTDAYRKGCSAMLGQFGSSSSGQESGKAAKVCLLLPDNVGGDPEGLLPIIDAVLAPPNNGERYAWASLTKSLALYRLNDFKGSAEWADKAETINRRFADKDKGFRSTMANLLLAMSRRRLIISQDSDAIAALKLARNYIDLGPPDPGPDEMGAANWLVSRTLLREAEALIVGAPTTRPTKALTSSGPATAPQ
jgi:tetratricopeptide (TPR) repeat protein